MFWPKDLLPADAGKARIMTYGYNANIAHFWARPSENRMDTFSNDFFQQLENDRYKIDAVNFYAQVGREHATLGIEQIMDRRHGRLSW